MGREPELAFFQNIHTAGQLAHEKMLDITSQQGNENQNHNEISLLTCQNGYRSNDSKLQVLATMWRKGNTCALLGGM